MFLFLTLVRLLFIYVLEPVVAALARTVTESKYIEILMSRPHINHSFSR